MQEPGPSPRRAAAPPSTISAARRRARNAKAALVATAAAAFAVVGLVARSSHPGASAQSNGSATRLSPPADLQAELQQEDIGGAGVVGPAQEQPSASTGTS